MELLKLTEVAQELGISEPTARRYVKTGKLPSVFVGGRYRVRREAVAEFLRQAEVTAEAPLPQSREESPLTIVGRVVTNENGDEQYRMVVLWNVPPEERERHRASLRRNGMTDFLEEELTTKVDEALAGVI